MADSSEITFSGLRLRVTQDGGSYTVASLPNSNQPDESADTTALGSAFTLDAGTGSDGPRARLVTEVEAALNAGGIGNASMLAVRLADKFVREHPGVVPE